MKAGRVPRVYRYNPISGFCGGAACALLSFILMFSMLWEKFHLAAAGFFTFASLFAQNYSPFSKSPPAQPTNQPTKMVQIREKATRIQQNATSTPTMKPIAPRASSALSTPDTPPQISTRIKWGAYAGWSASDVNAFEAKAGASPDQIAVFVGWTDDDDFPAHLAPVARDKERALIIFWEPDDSTQPPFRYDAILSGDRDAYIKRFAAEAKAYGGPVILVPFSEMNGEWSSWAGTKNGNTPEKFIESFRRIHGLFTDAQNVQFGWGPNAISEPNTRENAIEAYYPGDEYVDIVGVDGFNFGEPWQSFDEIFADALKKVTEYGKPIYIFSFASAEGPQKAAWVTDALTVQMPKYPLLAGWVWFNEDKEADWRVWSDGATLEAFQKAVR